MFCSLFSFFNHDSGAVDERVSRAKNLSLGNNKKNRNSWLRLQLLYLYNGPLSFSAIRFDINLT